MDMRRLVLSVLCLGAMLSFLACGGGSSETPPEDGDKTEPHGL